MNKEERRIWKDEKINQTCLTQHVMVLILRKYKNKKLEDGEYMKKKGEKVNEGKRKLT